MISEKLKVAIKLGDVPAYRIAHQAGIDPTTLSKLLCGIVKVEHGDSRVIEVGKIVGIPAEDCFEEESY
jgi:hypothetical protein